MLTGFVVIGMRFEDEHGNVIDHTNCEITEQYLVDVFIEENDVVLELGARYGTVSCGINKKLKHKHHQVVVEPDKTVWSALEKNRSINACDFYIVKGFLSNMKLDLTDAGYGSSFIHNESSDIPSFTFDDIRAATGIGKHNFSVLVADCEGFLETFFDEHPDFYNNLRLFIFEADYADKCDYNKIRNRLAEMQFINVMIGHQNVWLRLCQENIGILNKLQTREIVLKES